MLTVTLLCLIVCFAYTVRVWAKRRNVYELPPPLRGELPIIGHTHILILGSKDIWSLIKKISTYAVEQGGVIYGRVLGDVYYLVTDPDDVLTVANTCLQKNFPYDFAKNWLGQGLVTGSGAVHKYHRKLMGPWFTISTVHTFMKLFNDQARKMFCEMKFYCGKGPFDTIAIIKNIILETACLTTFGSDEKDCNFKNYSVAVHDMLDIITNRFTKPYLHNNLIYKSLGHEKKEHLVVTALTNLTNKFIQNKKNDNIPDKNSGVPIKQDTSLKTMLEFLLELDELLTDEEIGEELNTIIAASYDTVVHTLINALILLGTYPEVQEKIYDELVQVLGDTDRDVEKNDLQKLVYIKAVIKETLRVLPIAPVFGRYVHTDVKLKNYTIPAKSQCFILSYGVHRSPAWGFDANLFRPERWLDSASLPANANCFAGFSMGKRSCIGMPYAISLLTVILAHLVRQSKWTADINRVKIGVFVTMAPMAGHEINMERRETICRE